MAKTIRNFFLFFALTAVFAAFFTTTSRASESTYIVLSFHEIRDANASTQHNSIMAMSTDQLIGQFSWLQHHGYNPVSVDEILAAQRGERALPEKAILLTFDDGYRSFYTRVLPLLKLFQYPAVLAVVGKWMDTPHNSKVDYSDVELDRSGFISWQELKEIDDSGLVEIASHSYDMHHGIVANPQGNKQPAATALAFDNATKRYESIESYQQRIRDDLQQSSDVIAKHLGKKPRVLAWPYGAYNQLSLDIAEDLGFMMTLTLDGGRNDVADTRLVHRLLIDNNANIDDIAWAIRQPNPPKLIRVAHVDIDYVFDENPEQQDKNLGRLLDRIKAYQINTVYLQAFADPDGDGVAEALYFPNRHLPMRADLFNRVAWQLRTRANVNVYAWMPLLAFDIKSPDMATAYVKTVGKQVKAYRRLSPFVEKSRRVIGEIYEDLALHADFAGILFHDDAYLTDFEDANESALTIYREWGLPSSVEEIRASPTLFDKWTAKKTEFLIEFSHDLRDRVKFYRPQIKTARNIYAKLVLEPHTELWFAQSLDAFLEHYDYTALMAMPYMEGADDATRWLKNIAKRVNETPGAMDKVVFELQAYDWRNGKRVESGELRAHMHVLQENGVKHFGYYPDDFIEQQPELNLIRPAISLAKNPYMK